MSILINQYIESNFDMNNKNLKKLGLDLKQIFKKNNIPFMKNSKRLTSRRLCMIREALLYKSTIYDGSTISNQHYHKYMQINTDYLTDVTYSDNEVRLLLDIALEYGKTVSLVIQDKYVESQIIIIKKALSLGIGHDQLFKHISNIHNSDQLNEIVKGIIDGLDVSVYDDFMFTSDQMREIRLTLYYCGNTNTTAIIFDNLLSQNKMRMLRVASIYGINARFLQARKLTEYDLSMLVSSHIYSIISNKEFKLDSDVFAKICRDNKFKIGLLSNDLFIAGIGVSTKSLFYKYNMTDKLINMIHTSDELLNISYDMMISCDENKYNKFFTVVTNLNKSNSVLKSISDAISNNLTDELIDWIITNDFNSNQINAIISSYVDFSNKFPDVSPTQLCDISNLIMSYTKPNIDASVMYHIKTFMNQHTSNDFNMKYINMIINNAIDTRHAVFILRMLHMVDDDNTMDMLSGASFSNDISSNLNRQFYNDQNILGDIKMSFNNNIKADLLITLIRNIITHDKLKNFIDIIKSGIYSKQHIEILSNMLIDNKVSIDIVNFIMSTKVIVDVCRVRSIGVDAKYMYDVKPTYDITQVGLLYKLAISGELSVDQLAIIGSSDITCDDMLLFATKLYGVKL